MTTAEPGRFMRLFARLLGLAMRRRWLTIGASLIAFGASVYGMGFVQKQFFPASNRPELLVTMTLPKNASIAATEATTEQLEEALAGDADIVRFSSYVGGGAIRFYLPLDVQLDNDFIAETVVVARDLEARDRVKARLESLLAKDFPDVTARISRLELGPPVGWPRAIPGQRADDGTRRGSTPRRSGASFGPPASCSTVTYDWAEKSKELRIVVDQDRVRQAGLSSEQLAQALNRVISGSTVTQLRDSIYLVDVVARAETGERASVEALRNLQITTPTRRLRAPARAREVRVRPRRRLRLAPRPSAHDHRSGANRCRAWSRASCMSKSPARSTICARRCQREPCSRPAARWRRAPRATPPCSRRCR